MEKNNDNFMQSVMNAINGNNTMVSVNTDPKPLAWNGVMGCKSFTTPVTVSEAAEEVGANYEVKKHHMVAISDELYDAIINGTPITEATFTKDCIVSSHMATMREDNGHILGCVGKDYGVVSNENSLAFFNHILNGDISSNNERAVIETAGILNDGGRFYITAKMNSDIRIQDDDSPIEDYLLLSNDHTGSGSVSVCFTGIRVVCMNTLNAALRNAKNKLVYKHTSRVNERMDLSNETNFKRAAEVLKFHEIYKKAFIEDLNHLRNIKLKENDVMDMVCRVFADEKEMNAIRANYYSIDGLDSETLSTRKKNLISSLRDSVESGIGQNTNRGSGLWMYNGITTWANNNRSYKSEEQKFETIFEGDIAKKVQKMHDLILEYA